MYRRTQSLPADDDGALGAAGAAKARAAQAVIKQEASGAPADVGRRRKTLELGTAGILTSPLAVRDSDRDSFMKGRFRVKEMGAGDVSAQRDRIGTSTITVKEALLESGDAGPRETLVAHGRTISAGLDLNAAVQASEAGGDTPPIPVPAAAAGSPPNGLVSPPLIPRQKGRFVVRPVGSSMGLAPADAASSTAIAAAAAASMPVSMAAATSALGACGVRGGGGGGNGGAGLRNGAGAAVPPLQLGNSGDVTAFFGNSQEFSPGSVVADLRWHAALETLLRQN
ncbi:unnamed protein product, partial [Phaeothamnion confervicola]